MVATGKGLLSRRRNKERLYHLAGTRAREHKETSIPPRVISTQQKYTDALTPNKERCMWSSCGCFYSARREWAHIFKRHDERQSLYTFPASCFHREIALSPCIFVPFSFFYLLPPPVLQHPCPELEHTPSEKGKREDGKRCKGKHGGAHARRGRDKLDKIWTPLRIIKHAVVIRTSCSLEMLGKGILPRKGALAMIMRLCVLRKFKDCCVKLETWD